VAPLPATADKLTGSRRSALSSMTPRKNHNERLPALNLRCLAPRVAKAAAEKWGVLVAANVRSGAVLGFESR
jgi:hypothetical protein